MSVHRHIPHRPPLFHLHAGLLHDAAPALDVALDEFAELRRRAAFRLETDVAHASLHIGEVARLGDGVPAGTCRPFHEPNSRSGKPASATVGTSGRAAM